MDGEVAIARIFRPRGLEGEVFCEPYSDYLERFEALDTVTVRLPSGERRVVHVEAWRVYGRRLALKFRGFDTPEAVRALRQGVLLVPSEETFPIPDEDTFYVFEIVGMDVTTDSGEAVGKVADVLSMPANDVYVVNRQGEEILIPAVKAFVTVDRAARKVVVKETAIPIPGAAPDRGEGGTGGRGNIPSSPR